MKRILLLALTFCVVASFAFAGQNRVYRKAWPEGDLISQAYDSIDGTSGVTMAQLGSGVSLIGIIDQTKDSPEGAYCLEPGAWRMGYGYAFGQGTANAGTSQYTGSSDDSAVTIEYRYGISNKNMTTAQWQNLGESGTTLIGVWAISGTSSPVEFYPEYAAFIGIFAVPPGGVTQFCVPTNTYVVWQ